MTESLTSRTSGGATALKYKKIDDFMGDLEPLTHLRNVDGSKSYYIGATLGKGGFAKVFLAHETDHYTAKKRSIAIKVVPKKRLQRPDQEEKILREIDIQYGCKHEHIVKMFSSWHDSKMYCMVLEYCEIGSLSTYMKQFPNGRITEAKSINIGNQVLSALSYLHKRHIIHRDIKMGNILLTNGVAKLADFGLSLNYRTTPQHAICGTPNFLAPEVLLTKQHEPASDIWAFGCVLFCMLAGESPFRFTNMRETGKRIINVAYTMPDHFTEEAGVCIRNILVKEPGIRSTPAKILKSPLFKKYHTSPRKRQLSQRSVDQEVANFHKRIRPTNVRAKPSEKSIKKEALRPQTTKRQHKRSRGLCNRLGGLRKSMEGLKLKELSQSWDKREPIYVTKWVDNYKHTGFGYTLSNGSVGVLVNTGTTIIEQANTQRIIDSDGIITNVANAMDTRELRHCVSYLKEFQSYMNDNLISGGSDHSGENLSGPNIRVKGFYRCPKSIVMYLSLGVYQVNIMTGLCKGVKAIISSGGLLLINKHREKRFYRWKDLSDLEGVNMASYAGEIEMDSKVLIDVLEYSHELITGRNTMHLTPNFDHQHKLCRFIRCNQHIIS